METRRLPHTDLAVSRACFGCMTFGAQVDEAGAGPILDACFDAGINFFDTANVYNGGASETIVGKLLKGRRQKVVLASKVRGKMGEAANEQGLSRAAILKAVDDSLRRLQTDYLDLYYLHQPDYAVPIDETLEAMEQVVRAGKVRYPASSNYAAWQVAQMLWICDPKSYSPPYVSQPMYNLLARGIEQEYLPMCKEFGISNIVYNPLAGGLLTGKQQRDRPQPGTRFDNPGTSRMYMDRYWHPAYFDAVDKLRAASESAGRSLVSVSLNWLLHHSATDCIILGASKLDQLRQNLAALDEGPLPADLLTVCDEVWQDLRGVTPKYNR
jgi:aryl-alcohol dehydrogenase-like predicted oxidoreductase